MNSPIAEISKSALRLPANERALLLDRLFDSIDLEVDRKRRDEIDTNWASESERRIDAVERGELKVIDGPEVISRLRRPLQE
jgi:putative addiction module component (TIGR02574 family)